MNIIENNKLLAEFIGYTQPHPEYPSTTYWYKKDKQPLAILLFDSDWNWLMQIVEKIQLLDIVHEYNRSYDNVFKTWECYLIPAYKNSFGYIRSLSKNSEIEAVYNACVEFVKWYNEQNK